MGKTHVTYSKEFKLQTIALSLETGMSCLSIARKYDIPNKEIIRRWVKKYEAGGEAAI